MGDKAKKILYVVAGVAGGIIILFVAKIFPFDFEKAKTIDFELEGKIYKLLEARTASEKMIGLSGVAELKNADGMIFYFSPAQKVSFWNKNTHLDLELIWMRDGKIIGRDFLPSEDKTGLIVKESPGEVDAVVELVK